METSTDRYDEEANKIEFGTIAEQKDETAYDRRRTISDDDGGDAGLINFPSNRLYGRQEELRLLKELCTHEAPQTEAAKSGPQGFKSRAIFLGGISGAGKSALIKQTVEDLRKDSKPFFFISGKYSISRTKPPFSAISEAMKRLIRDTVRTSSKEDLKNLRKRLVAQHLSENSDETRVLASAIVPSIHRLFRRATFNINDDSGSFTTSLSTTGIGYDINAIKYAFLSFVKGFPSSDCPLIFFLDDLQWADEASFALLTWLLKDKAVRNFIFIGAYRSNEVDEGHSFSKLMEEIRKDRSEDMPTNSLEIANLGPDDIAEFIADSLERSIEDIMALGEAVYAKTLGNIFFVKQALEELVRCDAIYYDVMFFQWQIKEISRVDLEKFLVDDVVTMVKNKLYTLPLPLQKALSIIAFTRNAIDVETLCALLQAEKLVESIEDMYELLKKAVHQGVLLELRSAAEDDENVTELTYKFAHDRIQEAAMACVPKGEERDHLLERIAKVLLGLASQDGNEWMLFVAVHHINKLPAEMVGATDVAELNLQVGKIAISKAAFSQAAGLLRIGADRLVEILNRWTEHYNLTLQLLNALLEVEHSLGNEEAALSVAAEVLENAKTLPEKCMANVVIIEGKIQLLRRDFARVTSEALVILKQNGIDVPEKPSKRDVLREMIRLKLKQFFRPLHILLASYPPATDLVFETQMKLVSITLYYANLSKNFFLVAMLTFRAMRLVLTRQMITKEIPSIILYLAGPSKRKQKFEPCFYFAQASQAIISRFPEEPPKTFAKVNYQTFVALSVIRCSYAEAVHRLLELHKTLLTNGESTDSLSSAMVGTYCFFNASLPLSAMIEPKLLNFKELSINLKQDNNTAWFSVFLQLLYNLQGKSEDPKLLKGSAFDEEKALVNFGETFLKVFLPQFLPIVLMLATIFDDDELMEEKLDKLDQFPIFDPALPRQHMRMLWVGLAAAILQHRGRTKHSTWSLTCHKYFGKLSSAGSSSGELALACLVAVQKNTITSFHRAIEMCSAQNNFCLEALMNERCSELYPEGSSEQQDYLANAYYSYQDWGAVAKVRQMEEQHDFLTGITTDRAPIQINAFLRQSGLIGLARPPESSTGTSR